jgi:hypothetical protein
VKGVANIVLHPVDSALQDLVVGSLLQYLAMVSLFTPHRVLCWWTIHFSREQRVALDHCFVDPSLFVVHLNLRIFDILQQQCCAFIHNIQNGDDMLPIITQVIRLTKPVSLLSQHMLSIIIPIIQSELAVQGERHHIHGVGIDWCKACPRGWNLKHIGDNDVSNPLLKLKSDHGNYRESYRKRQ